MDTEESEGGSIMADSEGTVLDSETDNVSDTENRHDIGAVMCQKCHLTFPSVYHLHHHSVIAHGTAILENGSQSQSAEPLALNLKLSNAVDRDIGRPEVLKFHSNYDIKKNVQSSESRALDLSGCTQQSHGALDLSTAKMAGKEARKGDNSMPLKQGSVLDYSLPAAVDSKKVPNFEYSNFQGKPNKFFSRYPPPETDHNMSTTQEGKGQNKEISQVINQRDVSQSPNTLDRFKGQRDLNHSPGNMEIPRGMPMLSGLPYPFGLSQQMMMMNSSPSVSVSAANTFFNQTQLSQQNLMSYNQDISRDSAAGPVKATRRSRTRNTDSAQKNVLEIYECKVCTRKFSQVGNFHNHMKLHSEKVCVCGICKSEFSDSYELQRHMRKTHTGDMPYKCDECDREFSQYNNLRRHLRVHSGKSYKCHICSRTFNEVFYLEMHLGSHTGERTYRCGVCNLTFRDNAELQKHVQTHSAAELHTCEVCGKSFSKACVLRQHKKMHSGIRPYKCDICDKAFIHRHHLKIHSRMHSSNKPYQCRVCGKEFAQTSHLYKHIKQHTDISPELAKSIELEVRQIKSKNKQSPQKHSTQPQDPEQKTMETLPSNQDSGTLMLNSSHGDSVNTENTTDHSFNDKDKNLGIERTDDISSTMFKKVDDEVSQSESGVGSEEEENCSDNEGTLCIDEERHETDSIYSDITVDSERSAVVVDVHIKSHTNEEITEQSDAEVTSSVRSFRHMDSFLSDDSAQSKQILEGVHSSFNNKDSEGHNVMSTDPSQDDQYVMSANQIINDHKEAYITSSSVVKKEADSSSVTDHNLKTDDDKIRNEGHANKGIKRTTEDEEIANIFSSREAGVHNVSCSSSPSVQEKTKQQRRRRKKADQVPTPEQNFYPPHPGMGIEVQQAQQMYLLQLHQMQMALAASMATGQMFPFQGPPRYPGMWNPLTQGKYEIPNATGHLNQDYPSPKQGILNRSDKKDLNISSIEKFINAPNQNVPIEKASEGNPSLHFGDSLYKNQKVHHSAQEVSSSPSQHDVNSSDFLRNYYRFSGSPSNKPNYTIPRPLVHDSV